MNQRDSQQAFAHAARAGYHYGVSHAGMTCNYYHARVMKDPARVAWQARREWKRNPVKWTVQQGMPQRDHEAVKAAWCCGWVMGYMERAK